MKINLLFILLISAIGANAQNVPAYLIDPYTNEMEVYDTTLWTTPTETILLTSSTGVVDGANGLAVQPCTGDVYIVYKSGGTRYLGIVDLSDGVITEVGDLGDNVASITFGDYDVLYAVTGDGAATPETLYEVDLATGTMTFKATLGLGADGEVIGFCTDNGKLYHWSGNGTPEYESIDTLTNAATYIPISGYSHMEVWSSYYKGNGEFFIGGIDDEMMIVDTNGVTTFVGTLDSGPKGIVFPLRYIDADTLKVCDGDTAYFTATEGLDYEWYLDGVSLGITDSTLAATEEGDYSCLITVDSCTYFSNTAFLNVLNVPVVYINPSPIGYLCAPGDSVLLVGSMGGSAQWYENGTLMTGETDDSLWVFSTGGIYNMTKTNMNGCTDSAAVNVTIETPPTLSIITAAGTVVCDNDSLLITATPGASDYNWYLDGVLITDENNDSLYADAAGEYTVSASFGNCLDSTSTATALTASACDAQIKESTIGLKVYPNPTSEIIYLAFEGEDISNTVHIAIIDLQGKTVTDLINYSFNSGIIEVSVEGLSKGLYTIQLTNEGKVITKSFVKE